MFKPSLILQRSWLLPLGLGLACQAAKDRVEHSVQDAPAAPGEPVLVDTARITAAMVAEGDSIFHGRVAGGACFTCHGQNAEGSTTAPDLRDGEWLNGDGSYQFIANTVANGVLTPRRYLAPMPPMGGAVLSAAQVEAVAAYVFRLSHPASSRR
jgi:mono/diheme cytochrome c family protein